MSSPVLGPSRGVSPRLIDAKDVVEHLHTISSEDVSSFDMLIAVGGTDTADLPSHDSGATMEQVQRLLLPETGGIDRTGPAALAQDTANISHHQLADERWLAEITVQDPNPTVANSDSPGEDFWRFLDLPETTSYPSVEWNQYPWTSRAP